MGENCAPHFNFPTCFCVTFGYFGHRKKTFMMLEGVVASTSVWFRSVTMWSRAFFLVFGSSNLNGHVPRGPRFFFFLACYWGISVIKKWASECGVIFCRGCVVPLLALSFLCFSCVGFGGGLSRDAHYYFLLSRLQSYGEGTRNPKDYRTTGLPGRHRPRAPRHRPRAPRHRPRAPRHRPRGSPRPRPGKPRHVFRR